MSIPYIAVGTGELDNNEDIGESVKCRMCGEIHPVEYGDLIEKDGTRTPSKMLAFYKCGGKTYLAGIDGKAI